MKTCAIVPSLDAAETVGAVIEDLRRWLDVTILVVDDGSADRTSEVARAHGALVFGHGHNLGKGAAIRSGLREAARLGFDVALVADADGQHPGASAHAVVAACSDPRALVLGVRDLRRDGAPRANRFSNAISNHFLSRFAGRRLKDTQCGLRRYPVRETLGLHTRSAGYAFEAEVILRAVAANMPIVEVPIRVIYPPFGLRRSHFRVSRDPIRIIAAVLRTVTEIRLRSRLAPRP